MIIDNAFDAEKLDELLASLIKDAGKKLDSDNLKVDHC
jgi:ribosomal protein L22